MKTVLTISRYWHNPQIMTVIWNEGISLTLNLEDFIKALREEVGEIPLVKKKKYFLIPDFSIDRKSFDTRLEAAILRICERIKQESTKVVGQFRPALKENDESFALKDLKTSSVETLKSRLGRDK